MNIQISEKKNQETISTSKLILMVNLLLKNIKLNFSEYSLNQNSIFLEQISFFHVKNCLRFPECFCSQKQSDVRWENLIGDKKRKQYLDNYISNILKSCREINLKYEKKTSSNLDFFYIHFLIETSNSHVRSMSELSLIKKAKHYSLREQAYLSYLSQLTKLSFTQIEEQSDFGIALKFEEELNLLFSQYEDCLHQKLIMVQIINSDFINLQQFLSQTDNLYDKKKQLYTSLKKMAKVSQNTSILKEMIKGYIQNLSFVEFKRNFIYRETVGERLLLSQKKKQTKQNNIFSSNNSQGDYFDYQSDNDENDYEFDSLIQNQLIMNGKQINYERMSVLQAAEKVRLNQLKNQKRRQKQTKFDIDPFDSNSCTIFIKINNQELGVISRVQSSFFKIFGFDKAVGSNINRIIPNQIAKYHSKMLEDYLTNSYSPNYHSVMQKSLLLAQDKKGWAIPVKIKYTLGYISMDNEDAGLIATIQHLQTESQFILTDCESFKIQLSSELLYNNVFSNILSTPSQLHQTYLTRIMPIILLLSDNYFKQVIELQKEMIKNSNNHKFKQQIQPDQLINETLPINNGEIIQSLAFLPFYQSKEKAIDILKRPLDLKHLSSYISSINLQQSEIYLVKFKVYRNSNKYFKNNIIEILKIRKFKSAKQLQESLQLMKDQFRTLCNIEFTFDECAGNSNTNLLSPLSVSRSKNESYQTSPQTNIFGDSLYPTSRAALFQGGEKVLKMASSFSKENETKLNNKLVRKEGNNQLIQSNIDEIDEKADKINQETCPQSNIYPSPRIDPFTPIQSYNNLLLSQVNEELLLSNRKMLSQQSQNYLSNQVIMETPRKVNSIQMLNLLPDQRNQKNENKFANIVKQVMQGKNKLMSLIQSELLVDTQKTNTPSQLVNLVNSSSIVSQEDHIARLKTMKEKQSEAWKIKELDACSNLLSQEENRKGLVKEYSDEKSSIEKSMATAKSFAKRIGFKQSLDETKHTKKNNNDNCGVSSIKSGQTYTNEAKKMFAFKILSKRKNIGLHLLNLLGITCLTILLGLVLNSFFEVFDLFQKEKVNFKNVAWPMNLRSMISIQFFYMQFIRFYDNKIFDTIQGKVWEDFSLLNRQRIDYQEESFNQLYEHFLRSDQNRYTYFKNVTDFQFKFAHHRDFQSYPRQKVNQTLSLQYFLVVLKMYAKRFSSNYPNALNEQAMVNDNFGGFNVPLTQLQTDIETDTIQVLDNIESNVQLLMYLVIAISFVFVFIVFPVYYFAQMKVEGILKLFATFTPESLSSIISSCKESINRISQIRAANPAIQMQQSQKKIQQNNLLLQQLDSRQKKKNIATTSSIPRISYFMVICSLLVYVIVILQPIINNKLIQSLTQESRINLSLMRTIYDMRAHFASNLYLNFAYVLEKMCDNCVFYNRNYFKGRIPVFFKLNPTKLANLYDVIQKNLSQDRYKQEYYNNFFYKILQGNICEALRDYPQFRTDPVFKFNFERCSNIRSQMLTKGFQICTKHLLDQLPPIFEILEQPDRKKAQSDLRIWEKEFNILEFDEYQDYLVNTITALKNFMIAMSDDYLSYVQKIQTYLIIFYCSSLIFLFCFVWLKFYNHIYRKLYHTKQLLSLIDILVVISNPYIMNFINDQ